MVSQPKHPEIVVKLRGVDGNAFVILGTALKAARSKIPAQELKDFQTEATSGDYDHLLQTCMKWFTVT